MSDQCRICRESTYETNAKQLFETERNPLILQIELITGEWLNYEQGWPCNICIRCEDELSVAAAFRERCIQTQEELRLELVTGEAKPDHLDPLNIAQNDNEYITNHHLKDDLIIKDEHLDDESPPFIFDSNSDKAPAEFVVCNEENGKQIKICTDKMGEIKTNIKVNQIQRSQLDTHLKERYSEKTKIDFMCKRCRQNFKNERKLKIHLQRNKCKRDFECNICKKLFSSKQALKDHKLIHAGIRNFYCKLCDESFMLYKTLKRHELTKRHMTREVEENNKREINQRLDAQSDEESIAHEHMKDILSTKESIADEHLKDGDPTLIFNDVGIKSAEVVVDIKDKNKLTGEELLQCEFEFSDNRECEMDTSDSSHQIEKCQVATATEKQVESLCQSNKSRIKWSVTTEEQLEKANLKKKNGDFVCDICGKHYKHKWTLKDHLLRHTGVKDFECHTCKKQFSTKYELMTHEEIHTSEQNYHCELCDESFKMHKYLKRHERSNKHISKAGSMSDEQLMDKKNEINAENFICDQCGKQFPYKKCFMEHLHRHRGIKEFECNICKKRFALEAELQKHRDSVHAGIKRFSCKYCDMKFKYTQTKTYHQRKFHTFQLPFKCRYCEKAFITGYKRKSHELVHSNIRKFHCELCDVYFKQYTGLKNHMYSLKHKSKEKEGKNTQS